MPRLVCAVLAAALALGGLSACNRNPGPAPAELAKAATEAKAWMDNNAKAPGVTTTASGLQYKILRSGPATGMKPTVSDEVKVHYEGKLIDGTVFDSSYERGVPASMPLQRLVPAWIEALQMMRPGDEWVLYVPPALGYGTEGAGEIPPNSVLIFRIELIDVLPGPGRVQKG